MSTYSEFYFILKKKRDKENEKVYAWDTQPSQGYYTLVHAQMNKWEQQKQSL